MTTEKGFSLLEALVALFVFATAAIGISHLTTTGLRTAASLTDRILAEQVAENIAIDTITQESQQVIGRTSGQVTQRLRTYAWQRTISEAAPQGLLRIEISVRSAEDDQTLAMLSLLHFMGPRP